MSIILIEICGRDAAILCTVTLGSGRKAEQDRERGSVILDRTHPLAPAASLRYTPAHPASLLDG